MRSRLKAVFDGILAPMQYLVSAESTLQISPWNSAQSPSQMPLYEVSTKRNAILLLRYSYYLMHQKWALTVMALGHCLSAQPLLQCSLSLLSTSICILWKLQCTLTEASP